jgi:transposase/uncharacterized coiled-coil protein SlyX
MNLEGAQREAALLAVIDDLRAQLAAQTAQIEALVAQIAVLTARLGSDSSNSSKPPSSDGLGKRAPKSLRAKTGRRPGGQPGHSGATLQMVADPDSVVVHRPPRCRKCEGDLAGASAVRVEARQVFDLPAVKIMVTEHQLVTARCACGARTKAEAPYAVTRQVQYGRNIAALATLLVNRHYTPPERTAELLTDLTGTSISHASVIAMTMTAAQAIEDVFKPLAARLIAGADVVHADETGFRIDGKTRWVHSASTTQVAWIAAHDKRGRAAMDDIGVIPAFTGILVHDAWASYDTLGLAGGHQLCCAHVMRELQAVTDTHHHTDDGWCWAGQVKDAIAAIIHDPTTLDTNKHLIISALACVDTDPSPPGPLGRKHTALQRRLHHRLGDYLRFATTDAVPATNNPAEQEIRMVKVKTKVAGAMRTFAGANAFLAIRSYLSTARKHGIGYLDALTSLYTSNPWLPTVTP